MLSATSTTPTLPCYLPPAPSHTPPSMPIPCKQAKQEQDGSTLWLLPSPFSTVNRQR
ncbi:hypothetical protein F383_25184 [Gossypium arboreum]|uniref:Uncharacterized protein n=1 Tax=Gossypium arboreum TaxID=29729 RepID=A0A0B0MTT7_GOSAR|nr:hypothetical protein F383_25184 [Gossypium arboreum]